MQFGCGRRVATFVVRAWCSVHASPTGKAAYRVADTKSAARRGARPSEARNARYGDAVVGCAPGAGVSAERPDSVASASKGKLMAKATVDVLVDDLDGSDAVETVRIGWNGDWRELDLSKKNLAKLSRFLDKYWNVSRPVSANGRSSRRRPGRTSTSRSAKARRDPKLIRAWARDNGISVPARGRIPGDIERRYNEANGRS
jgi:hypothetical protein